MTGASPNDAAKPNDHVVLARRSILNLSSGCFLLLTLFRQADAPRQISFHNVQEIIGEVDHFCF